VKKGKRKKEKGKRRKAKGKRLKQKISTNQLTRGPEDHQTFLVIFVYRLNMK
jgi:hypothetical protein